MGKRTAEAEPNSKWPASNIEWRQTHSLLAYQRNSRIHSDAQVDQIAASMKEFGWTIPMLVDEEGIIIAGHGRALAAAKIGISSVPVMVAKGWTEAQKMAYRIADNQLPMLAEWDQDMLRLELTELGKMDFDLSLTGFDNLSLVEFMAMPASSEVGVGSLSDRFGVPPFSVLNAREGWWQKRKGAWISLGIESELGRGQERLEMSPPATTATMNFYSQKRKLESEVGRLLTTKEARDILLKRGTIIDDRSVNAKRQENSNASG